MVKIIAQTSQPSQSDFNFKGIIDELTTPSTSIAIGVVIFCLLITQFSGNKQGKLSTGKKAGTAEKLAAMKLSLQQIKARKHNKVTFWCGTPQYWWNCRYFTYLQTISGNSPTVWMPHMERSVLVLGAPGGGKTFGTIDRLAESCLRQGFPAIVYARKEDEMQFIAPLAARYGYDVRVFAPGEAYSEVINPLDFMRDADDQETAAQIAEVISSNTKLGSRDDDFFNKAASLLAKALIQLAKSSDLPDLATVYALMSTPGFLEKLDAAVQSGRISRWIAASFQQYLKAKESEKTIASIDTTMVAIFSSFIQKNLLPCFIGKTTIDLKLKGKKVIIFKLDEERRDVVGPLLAAALHMTIVKNLSTPRQDPIGIFIDELPSLYLKALPQWINEYRSNGACFILGVQSLEQLADAYGEKLASAITSACSTKVLYNPANIDTAKQFSDIYGQKEVTIKTRSISNTIRDGRTVTWNESLQTMPLIIPDEIMRLPQGKCVISNPGYGSAQEGSIPLILKIPIPRQDLKRAEQCHQIWQEQVLPALLKRVPSKDSSTLERALILRQRIAESILSIEGTQPQSSQANTSSQKQEIELITPYESDDSPW
jgi:type IV secretory pathway TraG/TraD family ATPase VirD4